MHRDDFDLLAAVMAGEHRQAVARRSRAAVIQCERTALAIAAAVARQEPTFDPVKFMLAACAADDPSQLTQLTRRQLTEQLGTRIRPRKASETPGLLPDEQVNTSGWAVDTTIGGVMRDVSESHAAGMAISALVYAGVGTLGELMARSDSELRAIDRIGPAAMVVIRKVKERWRAELDAHPQAAQRRLFPVSSEHIPAYPIVEASFPAPSPLAGPVPAQPPSPLAGRPGTSAIPRPGQAWRP